MACLCRVFVFTQSGPGAAGRASPVDRLLQTGCGHWASMKHQAILCKCVLRLHWNERRLRWIDRLLTRNFQRMPGFWKPGRRLATLCGHTCGTRRTDRDLADFPSHCAHSHSSPQRRQLRYRLGDINLFDIFLLRQQGFQIGAGPLLTVPMITDKTRGTGKW